MRIETDAGVFRAEGSEDGSVRIYQHALAGYTPHRVLRSMAKMDIADAHYVWTGTEHLVVFRGSYGRYSVGAWGPAIRQDEALAPAGANIDFVEIIDDNRLLVRTYEKGVEAETLACGTGAVASAAVARMLERTESDRIYVDMPGGRLTVGIRLEGREHPGYVSGRPRRGGISGHLRGVKCLPAIAADGNDCGSHRYPRALAGM